MVYGAGALGSLVASRLADVHEVTLIGRAAHVHAIRSSGLRVTGKTDCVQTKIRAMTEVDDVAPEVILVTTKSYDSAEAVGKLARFADRAIFVSLQNGLGNEEILAGTADQVLGAVINQGVTFLEPGAIYHAGEGETELGPFRGTSRSDAERVANAFTAVGLRALVANDIRQRIWLKAILNAAVNPITALIGLRTGQLLDHPDLEAAMRAIVEESVAIARACQIELDADSIVDKIRSVARATRDNKSSMLQDLERGRRTEIDAINGALIERAKSRGIPAPRNELLLRLIRAAERNKMPSIT